MVASVGVWACIYLVEWGDMSYWFVRAMWFLCYLNFSNMANIYLSIQQPNKSGACHYTHTISAQTHIDMLLMQLMALMLFIIFHLICSVILSNDWGRWKNGARLTVKKEGLLIEEECFLVEEQWGEWVICSQVYQSEGPVMGPSLRLRYKCLKLCWYLWGGRGRAVSFWCLQTPQLSSQSLLNL